MQGLDNISGHASNDRLLQLAAKGLFYEACVDYCQGQAVRDKCTLFISSQFLIIFLNIRIFFSSEKYFAANLLLPSAFTRSL